MKQQGIRPQVARNLLRVKTAVINAKFLMNVKATLFCPYWTAVFMRHHYKKRMLSLWLICTGGHCLCSTFSFICLLFRCWPSAQPTKCHIPTGHSTDFTPKDWSGSDKLCQTVSSAHCPRFITASLHPRQLPVSTTAGWTQITKHCISSAHHHQ